MINRHCLVSCLVGGFLMVYSAQARLGWTKEQMEKKFGAPKTNCFEYVYKVDDLNNLSVMYEGDKAVFIRYQKYDSELSFGTEKRIVVEHDKYEERKVITDCNRPTAISFSDKEAKEILEANFPGAKWTVKQRAAPSGDTLVVIDQDYVGNKNIVEYRRYDGLVYAYQCNDNFPQLVIFQPTKSGVIKNMKLKQRNAVFEENKKSETLKIKSKF